MLDPPEHPPSLGITRERVRAEVVRRVGSGEVATSLRTPFSPRVTTVLGRALKEALSLSHDDVGSEHILLALVGEKEGAAARVLADLDADPDRVRDLVIAELPEPRERHSSSPASDDERE